jgi:hypothetical protein
MMKLIVEGPAERVSADYRYLWAKYVRGFDPSQHCAMGLVGSWSKRVRVRMQTGVHLPFDETKAYDYIYICGVGPSYPSNLHMPMRDKEGGFVEVETYNGFRFIVENAELLTIPGLPKGFAGKDWQFTTCRNWQFGVDRYGLGKASQPGVLAKAE